MFYFFLSTHFCCVVFLFVIATSSVNLLLIVNNLFIFSLFNICLSVRFTDPRIFIFIYDKTIIGKCVKQITNINGWSSWDISELRHIRVRYVCDLKALSRLYTWWITHAVSINIPCISIKKHIKITTDGKLLIFHNSKKLPDRANK